MSMLRRVGIEILDWGLRIRICGLGSRGMRFDIGNWRFGMRELRFYIRNLAMAIDDLRLGNCDVGCEM